LTEQRGSLLEPDPAPDFVPDTASNPWAATAPPIAYSIASLGETRLRESRFRTYGIPLILFVVSLITTTAIGARFMQNFNDGLPAIANDGDLWPWPWLIADPARFFLGWPFSFSLLAILLVHEFGHYIACRYHGIRATLPWVLPAPSLSGTAGAIIQIRGRIHNRQALMDVGAYGPIVGYLASLPFLVLGLILSRPASAARPSSSLIEFGQPLTLNLLHKAVALLRPGTPGFDHALHHPILIAGWIGLFVTSLNLIPGGQLDGGHILYALSPQVHRWTTRLLPIALLICGIFFWIGWILWGLILFIPAMRHPNVPIDAPLDRKRLLLSLAATLIFLLTCTLAPFKSNGLLHFLR
jgi:membrane-associated protease RseP (regulator of RpoE activity)